MASSNIEFLGWVTDGEVAELYKHCRALIFPGEEDFGIVPVEAQASGRPVVAYGKGGALETVIPGTTGLLFFDQSPQALNAAVEKLEAQMDEFDPKVMRANAERFSKERFLREFAEFTEVCFNQHRAGASPSAGDIAL
jgi:glycosyltransferase involved in cell wall biosynthesis